MTYISAYPRAHGPAYQWPLELWVLYGIGVAVVAVVFFLLLRDLHD